MERFYPKPDDVWRFADGCEVIIISVKQKYGERDFTVTYIKKGDYDGSYEIKLREFVGKVDEENYPEATQKYLFEFVKEGY